MSDELPRLIRFLADDLKFRLRRRGRAINYKFYRLDLSEWKLRLSDLTPFIHVEAQHLTTVDTKKLVDSIQADIRNQYFQRHVSFLMVDGCSPELRDAVRLHIPNCVVLDEEDIQQITTGTITDKRMLDLICAQLPIASLSPYEISSPVTGSRFFGREYEIRTMRNHPDTDYALVGVRRIGKTSLLLELKRRLEDIGDQRIYFFDCSDFYSADDYIRAVVTEIDIRERERMNLAQFPHFLRYKSYRGKQPLVFLLDEIDHLISFDRLNNWALLRILRSSSNQGFCRYILTGYREVIEEQLKDQSPLFNMVTPLPLGNLSRDETRRLITVPMRNLGVSFTREGDLINQVFQETAGHPNYVQFYCYTLVQLMDRDGRRQISPNDLALIHGTPEFEHYVFRTFAANTTNLEKAVVYSLVEDHEQFTRKDVDIALKKRKVFATANQIEQACGNLRLAGVLDKQGQNFAFAIPILIQLLKDHYDVGDLFAKAREDGKL